MSSNNSPKFEENKEILNDKSDKYEFYKCRSELNCQSIYNNWCSDLEKGDIRSFINRFKQYELIKFLFDKMTTDGLKLTLNKFFTIHENNDDKLKEFIRQSLRLIFLKLKLAIDIIKIFDSYCSDMKYPQLCSMASEFKFYYTYIVSLKEFINLNVDVCEKKDIKDILEIVNNILKFVRENTILHSTSKEEDVLCSLKDQELSGYQDLVIESYILKQIYDHSNIFN